MKTAKLQKHGKGWQLEGEKILYVSGDFGLTDDMNGQEVEFDNTGGPVKLIRYSGKDYHKQQNTQQDMAKHQSNQSQRGGSGHRGYPQQQEYRGGQGNTMDARDPARAPYNFVPLNKQVVGGGVSPNHSAFEHLSGYIDIEVKALSPLFIKGHDGKFFRANEKPYLPGSSLRGLVRSIVEMASYSALTLFENKVLYRRSTLTDDGNRVYAGWLRYQNGQYLIFPGKAQQEVRSSIRNAHKYIFSQRDCTFSTGRFGHRLTVWKITLSEGEGKPMPNPVIESYQSDNTRSEQTIDLVKSIRKGLIVNALGGEIDRETTEIPKELGIPVFYRLTENDEVCSIGHAKYHRMPYSKSISDHIVQNKPANGIDFATSIFGTTEQAGKIYFEDASPNSDIKLELNQAKHPKILSAPKPTTYQHYLDQPKGASPSAQNKWSDAEAPIRGFKNYWHRKTSSNVQDTNTWIETKQEITKSHHAQINPVSPGSTFDGKIKFDNLTSQELGVLLLALDLPEDLGHKLGLGKPLGLGSIRLTPKLTLIQRQERYTEVFDGNSWATFENNETELEPYKNEFAKYIAEQTRQQNISDVKSYWEHDSRMNELKHLLTFEHKVTGVSWENRTRYMLIDHPKCNPPNEYKHRPILPTPAEVIKRDTYLKD